MKLTLFSIIIVLSSTNLFGYGGTPNSIWLNLRNFEKLLPMTEEKKDIDFEEFSDFMSLNMPNIAENDSLTYTVINGYNTVFPTGTWNVEYFYLTILHLINYL